MQKNESYKEIHANENTQKNGIILNKTCKEKHAKTYKAKKCKKMNHTN